MRKTEERKGLNVELIIRTDTYSIIVICTKKNVGWIGECEIFIHSFVIIINRKLF